MYVAVNNIGVILRDCRLDAGMSQREASEITGIKRSTLAMYEQGRREPNVGVVVRLLDAYGVGLDTYHHCPIYNDTIRVR